MKSAALRAGRATGVEYTIINSRLGKILIAGTKAGLRCLSFQEGTEPLARHGDWTESSSAFRHAREQISRYLAGDIRAFDLKLDLRGTPFQLKVWEAVRKIPYGRTSTYAEIARSVGSPRAARAVGAANAANPLPLIIPCHRVVGEGGRLTGYRGGIDLKRRLLELEGASSAHSLSASSSGRASVSAASRSAHSRQRLLSE